MPNADFYYATYPMVALVTLLIGFLGLVLFYSSDIFWKIKKTIIYFFVPEKIYLQGIVVNLKKTDIPLTSNPDDLCLHLYKVTIWKIMEDEYFTFNILYHIYEEIKDNELNLKQKISLPCKKFGYTGNKLFPVWNMLSLT